MAIMVLSQPMISTLFGDKWNQAPYYLTLLASNFLLAVSGRISMIQLLTGLGRTKMLMKLGLLTLFISIPLAFLLIPPLGIIGAIIGLILCGLPSMFLGLHWTWKQYEAKADFQSSARILLASAIPAIITFIITYLLDTAAWIKLATGGTIFIVTYLISAPLLRAVNKEDINNLKTMFSGLGVISKIINIPLNITEIITESLQK
jgi:O-antigen/teichoic acid export membrane protein